MGTAFLYGNGGGGGTGAALTVTAPAGCTVTVNKDGKTKTKVAGTDGVAVFKGLATGQWTLTITDGEQTAQKTVTITADYTAAITFFAATIHVTYPAGSTCTATDGVTTLTAPDTSGTWDCVVPNAGTWTVRFYDGETEFYRKEIEISENGQSADVSPTFLYELGNEYKDITGGFSAVNGTLTKNADSMAYSNGSASTFGWYATNNQITKGDATKLVVRIPSSGGVVRIGVSTTRTATWTNWSCVNSTGSGESGDFEVDLANAPDAFYVCIGCGVGTGIYTFIVDKIRME